MALVAPSSGTATKAPGTPATEAPTMAPTMVVGADRSTASPTMIGLRMWFSKFR